MTTDLFSVSRTSGADVATQPEDLPRLFVQRANAGDVDGLLELYEGGAVLAVPGGGEVRGRSAIRRFYQELLASEPVFTPGEQRSVVRLGDVALTSTRLGSTTATADVARRQFDGTWRWVLGRPGVPG